MVFVDDQPFCGVPVSHTAEWFLVKGRRLIIAPLDPGIGRVVTSICIDSLRKITDTNNIFSVLES